MQFYDHSSSPGSTSDTQEHLEPETVFCHTNGAPPGIQRGRKQFARTPACLRVFGRKNDDAAALPIGGPIGTFGVKIRQKLR
jgi:hypothetical protein